MTPTLFRRWLAPRAVPLLLAPLVALLLLSGCAAPRPATDPNAELAFEPAVAQASDDLIAQARALSAFRFALTSRRAIVVDPMLDAASGQQTAATQRLERLATARIAAGLSGGEFVPFRGAGLARADYLLTGTLTRGDDDRPKGGQRLDLALIDLKTGIVVARSRSSIRDAGIDNLPLRYDTDSPVLVLDRVVAGYVATTASAVGTPADALYLQRLPAAALIADATENYNAERFQESLVLYDAARAADSAEQLRVLNGIYLSNLRLGRAAEADAAFAKLVAFAMANDQLRVKFLFNPGGTTFWSDAKVSGPYANWLRVIAAEAAAAKDCLAVVGHTSRTGGEATNDALSVQRADAIRQRLIAERPTIAERSKAQGRGWRENIIGSGTDDAVDALDRRVEFKVMPCG